MTAAAAVLLALSLTACGAAPASSAAQSASASSAAENRPSQGDRPLAVLLVREGKPQGGQIVGVVRDGTLHSVQEESVNAALTAPAETRYRFSEAGTAKTAAFACGGCTIAHMDAVDGNVASADFSALGADPLPDGVYVGLGGDDLPLPPDWQGRTGEGWSADLNGDGKAETCAFTHAGDDWTMLFNGAETANFPLDGVYTTDFAAVPLDVDGDGQYEVALALMGRNTSVWVWKNTGEILLTYYAGD